MLDVVIRGATVVLHDRLAAPELVAEAPAHAAKLLVGKGGAGESGWAQERINAEMISLARTGHAVVRLKGGDPFVFGRGGEELDALMAAGIRVDVVPGITAATGCAAYAGFPLTHRDHASSVVFVSGHSKDGIADLDWRALANPRQTIVVYMGVSAAGPVSNILLGTVAAIVLGFRAWKNYSNKFNCSHAS